MAPDGKSSQQYPVNAAVPQGFILGPTLFLLYMNDLPDDVVCNILLSDVSVMRHLTSSCCYYLWQQLELASELESDLQDFVDRGRKWLFDFNSEKTQLVSFDRSINIGAINVRMDRSFL